MNLGLKTEANHTNFSFVTICDIMFKCVDKSGPKEKSPQMWEIPDIQELTIISSHVKII